ncbi:Putative Catalytic activity: NADH acceptor <=_ NAD() reduced acceptor [Aspergillus calidoustus]|uniref:Putative Catalytic activity: NADH acceptor <=> NAD( ) reduced acceptor n=1 Tax=Aspergillus calidoustus TaxID=454130 RepID=A0A0U5C5Z1_ASPCI|nr:Putative Catalytic activity: NADH acceptor <=> NAD() reduced acceptor [Aspergillus calidoustus]
MGHDINEPLKLKCGLVLPNRLVKAAMAEGLADKGHLPGERISRVYSEWAKGGWGALLTGNIQVDVQHLGGYGDLATRSYQADEPQFLDPWKQYANACQSHGTPAIAQICHPGRQSPRGAGERGLFAQTIAPSAIPLNMGTGVAASIVRNIVFGSPRAMSKSDIDHVVAQFVNCARVLAQCGFSGIEIHAAHGYLLSQFLSPASNDRQDEYGGSAKRRALIVIEIIQQIRKAVPASFCIGIKLNSADHNASDFEDTMTQIQLFSEAGIDFLEISGGSYEDPTMMGRGVRDESSPAKSQSTAAREAFFLDFAAQTRKQFPDITLLLTGGFRSREGIEAALKAGVCDLVGIGRPAVLRPDFPRLMMDPAYTNQEASVVFSKVPVPFLARLLQIKSLGGGAETEYFRGQIHRVARGLCAYAP